MHTPLSVTMPNALVDLLGITPSSILSNQVKIASTEITVVKIIKTPIAEFHQMSNGKIVYNWDKLYASEAYHDVEQEQNLTDQITATIGGKKNLIRIQVTKKESVDASKTTQKQAIHPIIAITPNGGIIYNDNGKQSYYGGALRENLRYVNLAPGQEFKDTLQQVEQLCDPNICYRVTTFVVERASNLWQLPINKRLETERQIVQNPKNK